MKDVIQLTIMRRQQSAFKIQVNIIRLTTNENSLLSNIANESKFLHNPNNENNLLCNITNHFAYTAGFQEASERHKNAIDLQMNFSNLS